MSDLEKALKEKIAANLEKSAVYLVDQIKVSGPYNLNEDQPYDKTYHGLEPSLPGDPPKKVRGDLLRSLTYEMAADGQSVKVGSNSKYVIPLEYGTQHMAPRPFFRRTIDHCKQVIAKIIASGSK